jgi:hypothetical protein
MSGKVIRLLVLAELLPVAVPIAPQLAPCRMATRNHHMKGGSRRARHPGLLPFRAHLIPAPWTLSLVELNQLRLRLYCATSSAAETARWTIQVTNAHFNSRGRRLRKAR